MTENRDRPKIEENKPLALDDAIEFLTQRCVSARCSMCGWSDFTVVIEPNDSHVQQVALATIDIVTNTVNTNLATPVAQVVCKKCSHVHLFSVKAIEEWLQAGKPMYVE